MKFNIVMLIVNIVALILGMIAALNLGKVPGLTTTVTFGLVFLIGFSIAAYFLDFSRLYIYGLLVGFAPVIGNWLYTNMGATQHGFPITFGVTAGIMILTGLAIFIRLLRDNPVPREAPASERM